MMKKSLLGRAVVCPALLLSCVAVMAAGCSTGDEVPTLATPATEGPTGLAADVLPLSEIDHYMLARVDVNALLAEDAVDTSGRYRVSAPQAVDLSLATDGTSELLADGGTLWRLRVSSEGAIFLSFMASRFWLPEGAQMYLYSVEQDYAAGPYTARNNNDGYRFGSPAIPAGSDGSAVVEIYTPAGAQTPVLELESVSHGYQDFRRISQVPYRNGLLKAAPSPAAVTSCHQDINCAAGNDWQLEKNAVAETYDGQYVCTGTLLNNVEQDCKNYFLTANHCTKSKGKANSLVFYWNYENSSCGGNDAPVDRTSVGSTLRITKSASDFTLLELNNDPDPSYDVYYAGWNNSATAPSSAVCIHHPNDLPKKISIENDPLQDGANFSGSWGGSHWRVTGWDVGTTEGGSSGSAIFNSAHQVVGQLTGGTGDCNGGWDEYGKMSTNWSLGLAAWLDPNNTGAVSLNGSSCGGSPPPPPPPPPTCELAQLGEACNTNADCCSNKCKGKPGSKTCK